MASGARPRLSGEDVRSHQDRVASVHPARPSTRHAALASDPKFRWLLFAAALGAAACGTPVRADPPGTSPTPAAKTIAGSGSKPASPASSPSLKAELPTPRPTATAEPPAAPTSPLDPATARLAEATSLLIAGDAERASAALAEPTPPLEDHRALLQGRALLALGKPEQAFRALERIQAPRSTCPDGDPARGQAHPLYVDAALLKARVLAESEPSAAAEILAALPPAGDTLAEAADLNRRAGDEAHAEAVEARLLTEVPDSPEARALAKQIGLEGILTRLPDTAARLTRIRKLLDTHQNADAKAEAKALVARLGEKSEHTCELAFISGKADRKLRQYGSAITTLKKARERCAKDGAQELAVRAALLEVQVRTIRGQAAETEKVIAWMSKRDASHSFLDDARLLYANLLEDSGRKSEASKLHREIADDPKNDQAHEAAWRLAYAALREPPAKETKAERTTRLGEATRRLASIVASPEASGMDRARARFWLGSALLGSDDAQAKSVFEALVLEPSFYGWLALDLLETKRPAWAKTLKAQLLSIRDAEMAPFSPPPSITSAPEAERARRFGALQLPLYAEAELDLLSPCVRSDDEALALALALDAVGAHPRAQQILRARPSLRGPLTPSSIRVLRALYSRPYLDLVEKAATASKIESFFLLALVREESTFDPKIVSWAGATGLAQLMPGTAITAHIELGLGRLDVERLTDPELNLRLGARVLADGMRDFGAREPLALAAYNGGPGVAKKLSGMSPPRPFEHWVEEISIRETQRYVKRVMETWGIYRFLYDRAQPFIPLPRSIGA